MWIGLAALVVLTGVLYVSFNSWIMPTFTRHEASIEVPNVVNQPSEDAATVLEEAGLETEQVILRKPNLPRDVVIDQSPGPRSLVKPGRRVYLTVNSGDTTTVLVPRVETYGIRVASNMLALNDLIVGEILPDSIPSFYEDIITLQEPSAGERVPPGTVVNLWYGTGLGDELVVVPDVTGLTAEEAQQRLLDVRLRSIVIGEPEEPDDEPLILEQSHSPGTSVSEGFEIRLRYSRTQE